MTATGTAYSVPGGPPGDAGRPASSLLERAAVALACIAVVVLFVVPAGAWPWDHDEVHSLVELGQVPLEQYPGPVAQLQRMHRLVPVWRFVQNSVLTFVPHNEWGTRLMPSVCGAAVVLIAFFAGRRARGRWFGWSLLLLAGGSQTLIWLSQQNRFYALALLWLALAYVFIWLGSNRWWYDVLAVACASAAVLSHNLTLIVFGLGAVAAVAAWLIGTMPLMAARRAVLAAAVTAGIYAVYLRPILAGWVIGNTGGTPPIISFVAQLGITPLALSIVGFFAVWRERGGRFLPWWSVLLVLSLAFVTAVPWTLGTWNPRYALFFMPPVWVMGAAGAAVVAEALAPKRLAAWWLAAVLLLLLPKLASHLIDGSRHDFRSAAAVVAARAPDRPVLSNWPATLQYYLERATTQHPVYWVPGQPMPDGESVVVYASNAWEPILQLPGRIVTVVGEIGRRRFDEQSHLVRVYLVSARER